MSREKDLDCENEADCAPDDSGIDIEPQTGYTYPDSVGIRLRSPKLETAMSETHAKLQQLGIAPKARKQQENASSGHTSDSASIDSEYSTENVKKPNIVLASSDLSVDNDGKVQESAKTEKGYVAQEAQGDVKIKQQAGITRITDDMIEDGAHVVFDWDNTLKLYDTKTRQLSCRVDKDFLVHLKRDRHCKLYIISAIRPSKINLEMILFEVEKLELTDVFMNVGFRGGEPAGYDSLDGLVEDQPVVKPNEFAHKGNVIICGYDKAETFLKLSGFDASKGEKVVFFDDESVNIDNFGTIVPSSKCFLCE